MNTLDPALTVAPVVPTGGATIHLPCYADKAVVFWNGPGNPIRSIRNQYTLSKPELETLVASYGGLYLPISGPMLLMFSDYHWARRCQQLLIQLGLSTQRCGCHLQLQEP